MFIKQWYSGLPIRRKILFLAFSIMTMLSLLALITLISITYNLSSDLITSESLSSVAHLLNTDPYLTRILDSKEQATSALAWIDEFPLISAAAIYRDGVLYAQYPAGYAFSGTDIHAIESIFHIDQQLSFSILNSQEHIFELALVGQDRLLKDIFLTGLATFCLVQLVAIVLTFIGTTVVQRSITNPIAHLMKISHIVYSKEDFHVRAQKINNDEIGALVDAFNGMLSRIEVRDLQLHEEKEKAELSELNAQKLATETKEANRKLEFEVHVRSKIERKLTEFQTYLNSIINSMPSALIAMDDHFFVALWNTEATNLSGTSLETALGDSLEQAFPLLANYMDDISHALIERETRVIEKVSFKHHSGKQLLLNLTIYPLIQSDTSGSVIRIDDVTEKMQLQEVIVQTEKMMSVGGLAAGMAHEINNPLSAIIQGAQNIRRRLDPLMEKNREVAEQLSVDIVAMRQYLEQRNILTFIDNIYDAGDRAAHIVTNMLQFSRKSGRDLSPQDVYAIVTEALEIASSDFDLKQGFESQQISILNTCEANRHIISCAKQEIEQVIINLLKNAAQTIKEKYDTHPDNYQGQISIGCHDDGNCCVIEIQDNGLGMEEDTRKRIFEPFFTTKDIGVGTGLGLSVSYFIITSHHHGTMEAKSTLGAGTTFVLKLPMAYQ
ncbi:sensor histidine kinase [Gynuella sp.]|uniref:sensor histidine kinase n=1 Tax=Gynuella sp. TaxID=2969146 RepID=UPI003D102CE1